MPRLKRAVYDELVKVFRQQAANGESPNFSKAAEAVGCERKASRHCFLKGYPAVGLAPIGKLIEVEQIGRRERVAREEVNRRALQDAVRDDSETRALKEIVASRATLDLCLYGARPVLIDLWHHARRLCESLRTRDVAEMTPAQIVATASAIARISTRFAQGVRVALEVERLRLGDPTAIIRIEGERELTEASPEQAMQMANEVLETARRLQALQSPDQADQKDKEKPGGGLLN